MDQDKKPSKSIFRYYIIILLVALLLNALVFPRLMSPNIVTVDYGTFIRELEAGDIKTVEMDDTGNTIYYIKNEQPETPGKEQTVYAVGVWPNDTTLVQKLTDAGVQYSKVVPQENSPLLEFLMTWILPIGLMILGMNLVMRGVQKRMGGNALTLGKSNAKIYVAAQTGKTFADVAGQDEAKDALREIVDYLHSPEKYRSIGAHMPKGALLVGPPGTGKTLLAKAVAGEAGVPFFSISGSEFVEMFVGMGAARVRDLFKQAQEKAPCIIFIDEIDTIGKKRDGAGIGGNDEREQTLNQLLAEMDGFDGSSGVVILAATNRPETLDKALLRPGRFDRRIPVELPDMQGRIAILNVHAKDVRMGKGVDMSVIARATSGASGAELANIINEAALRAVRMGRNEVAQGDLEEAVETVIAGAQRKGAVISDKEKRIIAYHEIGHALVAARQTDSAPVTKITIIPRTSGALGYTMQVDEEEKFLLTRDEALNKIATLTGGRAAEELVFSVMTSGASNDIEQATRMARAIVTRYGMSEEFDMTALETVSNQYLGGDTSLACSSETAAKIDAKVVEIIKSAHKKAYDILAADREKLDELAAYLLKKETITGEEFMSILHSQEQ